MRYALGDDRISTADERCWIAPTAVVIGKVRLGSNASVWWHSVLRGDHEPITVGEGSNIQDGCVLHTDFGFPVVIGKGVTVGHMVALHGCTIGDDSLIGIGATILSHAVIGKYCLVGAGALITERKSFPDRSLIIGAPARRVRDLTDDECRALEKSAAGYAERGRQYARELVAR